LRRWAGNHMRTYPEHNHVADDVVLAAPFPANSLRKRSAGKDFSLLSQQNPRASY
jgi:hypothetical protein